MSRQPRWLPTTKLRQCHLCCNSLVMSLRRVTAIDHANNPRWTASGCHALNKQALKQYSVQEHELGFKICLSLKAASIIRPEPFGEQLTQPQLPGLRCQLIPSQWRLLLLLLQQSVACCQC